MRLPIEVVQRPFAAFQSSGAMLPDGTFVTSFGQQLISAYFHNAGASDLPNVQIFLEGLSDQAVVVTPRTETLTNMPTNSSVLIQWDADFSNASPGIQYVSFVMQNTANDSVRIIKKIFVTKINYDSVGETFTAETPEGTLNVNILSTSRSYDLMCSENPHSKDCYGITLPEEIEMTFVPTVPFSGQLSDLPFSDGFWKIFFLLIFLFLLAGGTTLPHIPGLDRSDFLAGRDARGFRRCCGYWGTRGSTQEKIAIGSTVASGLAAAAFADVKDPFRRGEEATMPASRELTISEKVRAKIAPLEPIVSGRPYSVQADWIFNRMTTGQTYTYSISEIRYNEHLLDSYSVMVPDTVRAYAGEKLLIKANFMAPNSRPLKGSDLYVWALLLGPHGLEKIVLLQDSGIEPDDAAQDGTYTGIFDFKSEADPYGVWYVYVFAQDINQAQEGTPAIDQARFLAGLFLTNQMIITFEREACPFKADAHVLVI